MIRKEYLDAMVSDAIWYIKDNFASGKYGLYSKKDADKIQEFLNMFLAQDAYDSIDKFCIAENIEEEE